MEQHTRTIKEHKEENRLLLFQKTENTRVGKNTIISIAALKMCTAVSPQTAHHSTFFMYMNSLNTADLGGWYSYWPCFTDEAAEVWRV